MRFRAGKLVVSQQFKNLVEARDLWLNAGNAFLGDNAIADTPHCRYCSPHRVVGPDHSRNTGVPVCRGRCSVVFRWNNHDRQAVLPGACEREDLLGGALARVNEDCVSARRGVGLARLMASSIP